RVPLQAQVLAGVEAPRSLARGQHRDDAPPGDRDAVIVEHRSRGLDRDHPARADEEVDRLHFLKKTPRSGGALEFIERDLSRRTLDRDYSAPIAGEAGDQLRALVDGRTELRGNGLAHAE